MYFQYQQYTSFFKLPKAAMVASLSIGKSLVLPKIFGKNFGCKRPSIRLASVTVSGPPVCKQNTQTFYCKGKKTIFSFTTHENFGLNSKPESLNIEL